MADRPDLLEAAYSFDEAERVASIMQHDEIAGLATASRISRLWPECFLVLVRHDDTVAARAVSIPFDATRLDRATLPDTGWDGVVIWCAQDTLDGRPPSAACALEIAVDPQLRGQGISGRAVQALRENAVRLGLSELVAPVRPPDKVREPRTPMAEYISRRREDGLPADRWLRVHVRAGGRIDRVAPFSMIVTGTLEQWRAWTGLPFHQDGPIDVPGGLVPVVASQEMQVGTYAEPNVWVRHVVM